MSRTRHSILSLLLWAAIGLPASPVPATAAPKTDIVSLRNGDRITCEIEAMERGRLRVATDDLGTIDIEWDVIDSVRADAMFEIEDIAGAQYFGALRPGTRGGTMRIQTTIGPAMIEMSYVDRISRLGEDFWQRLEGSLDLGTSYASANDLFTFDVATEIRYERPRNELILAADANLTRQEEVEDTRRWSVSFDYRLRRPSWWFGFGQSLLEENRELGFDLRGSLAAGVGRYFLKSHRDDLLSAAGFNFYREYPIGGESQGGTEFLLTIQYNRFTYDFPKVDILIAATAYQGLTEVGGTRLEAEARIRREVLRDFNVFLRGYESYDSEPATAGAEKNDFGYTFGIGWTF